MTWDIYMDNWNVNPEIATFYRSNISVKESFSDNYTFTSGIVLKAPEDFHEGLAHGGRINPKGFSH